jgi:hypothetical protein
VRALFERMRGMSFRRSVDPRPYRQLQTHKTTTVVAQMMAAGTHKRRLAMLEARVTRGGFETIHGPKDGHGEVGMGMKRMHVEHVAGMRNLVAQRKVVGVQATARIASARSRRASLNAPAHGNVVASKTSRSGSMMVARASLQWCRHERSANLKRQP